MSLATTLTLRTPAEMAAEEEMTRQRVKDSGAPDAAWVLEVLGLA